MATKTFQEGLHQGRAVHHCSLSQHLMSPGPEAGSPLQAPEHPIALPPAESVERVPGANPQGLVQFLYHAYSEGFTKDLGLPALPGSLMRNPALDCILTIVSHIGSKPVSKTAVLVSAAGTFSLSGSLFSGFRNR